MPYTLNGVGTKYYGRRDIGADNSFITTEWIVLLYIPILPIGSFRVQPTGESVNVIIFSSTEYRVRRVPFNWKQIRNVYLTAFGIFGAFYGVLSLLSSTVPKNPDLNLPTSAPSETSPSSPPR